MKGDLFSNVYVVGIDVLNGGDLVVNQYVPESEGAVPVVKTSVAMGNDAMRQVDRVALVHVNGLLGVIEPEIMEIERGTRGVIKFQIAPAVIIGWRTGRKRQNFTVIIIILRREYSWSMRTGSTFDGPLNHDFLRGGIIVGEFDNRSALQHAICQVDLRGHKIRFIAAAREGLAGN